MAKRIMRKVLISTETYDEYGHLLTAVEDLDYYMVDPDDIEECDWWSGEEGVYRYDEEKNEMNHLSEEYTYENDGDRYFIKEDDWSEGEWLCKEDFEKAKRVKITYWEGFVEEYSEIFVEITDSVSHNNYRKVTLAHGIRTTDVILDDPDGFCHPSEIEIDVEQTDYIPMDYPDQPFVAIYEGTDEDGRRIEVRETSPFCEDDCYPVANITYLD